MTSVRQSLFSQWAGQLARERSTAPHDCPECGKCFCNRSSAARHIIRIHKGDANGPVTLDAVQSYLHYAEKLHNRIDRLSLAPGSVGVPLAEDATLSEGVWHLEQDMDKKWQSWQHQIAVLPAALPHRCPMCERMYSTRSNAVRHIVEVHIGDNAGFTLHKVSQYMQRQQGETPSIDNTAEVTTTRSSAAIADAAPLHSPSDVWANQLTNLKSNAPHRCPMISCQNKPPFTSRSNAVQHIVRVHMKQSHSFSLENVHRFLGTMGDGMPTLAVDSTPQPSASSAAVTMNPTEFMTGTVTSMLSAAATKLRTILEKPFIISGLITEGGTKQYDDDAYGPGKSRKEVRRRRR